MILFNGTEIKPTIFPDKTSQVWKLDPSFLQEKFANVEWRFESEGEFMHLAQLKALIDKRFKGASLYLPYLPYGRQDKLVSNKQTFALHVFANLLNTLNFQQVTCFDPHSDVAQENIANFTAIYPIKQVIDAMKYYDIICYPDRGAMDKYREMFPKFECVSGNKIRNQETGEISGYEIIGAVDQKRVLIVDDICDGGATFISAARCLYNLQASDVGLFVSHGLFTKGLQPLRDAKITKIFTKEGRVE